MRLAAPVLSLATVAGAATSFWGPFVDPACDSCLDSTVAGCGGESDPDFGFCMCHGAGAGWNAALSCQNTCNAADLIWGTSGLAINAQWVINCVSLYPSNCYTEFGLVQPAGSCDADLELERERLGLDEDDGDSDGGGGDDEDEDEDEDDGAAGVAAPAVLLWTAVLALAVAA